MSELALERIIQCDRCKENFAQKYVFGRKGWSQINEITYWTNGKLWDEFRILCRQCLKVWYEENRKEFNSLVELRKRKIFSNYKNNGLFDKKDYIIAK
ncbi:MAG: hypothetical protein MRECE_18c009 [Mycoplasmataceae bacterium CE_OT135]|nr:MAG: hypothetical protein MRECE_29c010 [Mycoplasmataceae bacterium CE_OT135]KLL03363.1 MAG: hypothetical protein MRECE_18c009 [Mycoplasmataceae bacterium CE_OT135]